ncbi:CorA metal ion transporter [Entomortierella chlamydospora]|uniref:CorA metal ion transporter n=1 Tax=Entomortierella chlamydospora TaxID=101097 RepID=A0A9P6MT95_9FUNG|nr:CorA metal ion transporter [Entomortierella chlamydospora]
MSNQDPNPTGNHLRNDIAIALQDVDNTTTTSNHQNTHGSNASDATYTTSVINSYDYLQPGGPSHIHSSTFSPTSRNQSTIGLNGGYSPTLRSERLLAHQQSSSPYITRNDFPSNAMGYRGNGIDGTHTPIYQHHRNQHLFEQDQLGNNGMNIDYEGLDAAVREISLTEESICDQETLMGEQSPDKGGLEKAFSTGSASVLGNAARRRSSRKAGFYSERAPRSVGMIEATSLPKILVQASAQKSGDTNGPKVFSDLLKGGCFWIDILDPSNLDMQILSKHFHIHPLTIEDISTEEIREKYEVFRNYYFVCFRTFDQDYNSGSYLQPISMYSIVLRDGIITFHFRPTHHHLNVLHRLEQFHSLITLTPDWINYALLDDITDSFASPIQTIEYEVDSIDELVLLLRENETSDMLRRIGSCRKNVMMISRLLTNKAEVIRGLMKRFDDRYTVAMNNISPGPPAAAATQGGEAPSPNAAPSVVGTQQQQQQEQQEQLQQQQIIHSYHNGEIMLYLGDILDHVLTMLQSLYSYEKILSRSHSNYLAQISLEINQSSNRTNNVVGKLTFFASLIVPMTFVAGLWG